MDRCWPRGMGRMLLAEGSEAHCVALCGLRGEISHRAWPEAWGQGRALSQAVLLSEARVPCVGVLGCSNEEPWTWWLKATETILSQVWSLEVCNQGAGSAEGSGRAPSLLLLRLLAFIGSSLPFLACRASALPHGRPFPALTEGPSVPASTFPPFLRAPLVPG